MKSGEKNRGNGWDNTDHGSPTKQERSRQRGDREMSSRCFPSRGLRQTQEKRGSRGIVPDFTEGRRKEKTDLIKGVPGVVSADKSLTWGGKRNEIRVRAIRRRIRKLRN